MTTTVFDFTSRTIQGKACPLSTYRNKMLLIVNTASRCGSHRSTEAWSNCISAIVPRGSRF